MTNPLDLEEIKGLMAKAEPNGDCLEWQGSRNSNGYGSVYFRGRRWPVHRLVMTLIVGRDLGRLEYACHRCDNPPCIKPEHLFVGSPADNSRDMVKKGRGYREKTPTARRKLSAAVRQAFAEGRLVAHRGADCPTAKLTEEVVQEIRSSDESQVAVARRLGVSQSLISLIRSRKVWAHV